MKTRPMQFFAALLLLASAAAAQSAMPRIAVSGNSFIDADSGEKFTPWGFNYDRDWAYRLLEEYWDTEWDKVEEDFRELRALGANVIRIHLQYNKFMDGPNSPNEINLASLRDLVVLAERLGIYLDLTGLGSYRPKNDPAWYVNLSEAQRWSAQASFWGAVAKTLADRPGVFAFNLMNEPVVSGDRLERGAWVHPHEIEGLNYIQFINLDPDGRDRPNIAVAWIRQMKQAIRAHDPQRLITVGQFPLLNLADATGFAPKRIASEVDFISVHIYPQDGRVQEALDLLKEYDVGLPILIEETFPLSSGIEEYRQFLDGSRKTAAGWLSFYWGEPPEALMERSEPAARLVIDAIQEFKEFRPQQKAPSGE